MSRYLRIWTPSSWKVSSVLIRRASTVKRRVEGGCAAETRNRMKILFLTPSYVDYLSDQIYTGLCKLIGCEYVVYYTYKRHYHDPHQKVPFIPQNPGRMYQFD